MSRYPLDNVFLYMYLISNVIFIYSGLYLYYLVCHVWSICIYFGAPTWCEVGGYISLFKYVLFSFVFEYPTERLMWLNINVLFDKGR